MKELKRIADDIVRKTEYELFKKCILPEKYIQENRETATEVKIRMNFPVTKWIKILTNPNK